MSKKRKNSKNERTQKVTLHSVKSELFWTLFDGFGKKKRHFLGGNHATGQSLSSKSGHFRKKQQKSKDMGIERKTVFFIFHFFLLY